MITAEAAEQRAAAPEAAARRHRAARTAGTVGACMALAAAMLLLPIAVTYDAWGWLVWGRQVVEGALDTTGGPSWKPLPVVPATVVSLAGDLAPALWLVLARTLGFLAVVAVYRLAARWGGPLAGWTAAGLVLLTPDDESGYLRLVAEGHIEPATVAFALWAVDRHLEGHRAQALLLCAAVALSRPEAWPFLALYALWLLARRTAPRWLIGAALLLVPVLWFGGDWWGSGDWWHGADVAQVATGTDAARLERALDRAGEMVPWPAWAATTWGVVAAVRARARPQLVVGAVAVGWTAVVVAMCVALRYAALGRFFLVPAAIACVGAGLGVRAAVDAIGTRPRRAPWSAAPAVVLLALVPFLWPRVQILELFTDEAPVRARFERDLDDAVAAAGGRDRVAACGLVAVENTDLAITSRPALAWKLDLPLSAVWSSLADYRGVAFAQQGSALDAALAAAPDGDVALLGRSDEWAVYAVACPGG